MCKVTYHVFYINSLGKWLKARALFFFSVMYWYIKNHPKTQWLVVFHNSDGWVSGSSAGLVGIVQVVAVIWQLDWAWWVQNSFIHMHWNWCWLLAKKPWFPSTWPFILKWGRPISSQHGSLKVPRPQDLGSRTHTMSHPTQI